MKCQNLFSRNSIKMSILRLLNFFPIMLNINVYSVSRAMRKAVSVTYENSKYPDQ